MPEISVAEARNTLTQLIHKAESGEVVRITRRGKPVAVLVSKEEYERLEAGVSKKDFWQAVEDWRAQAGFDWPELTPDEVDGWRARAPGAGVLMAGLNYLLDSNILLILVTRNTGDFADFVALRVGSWSAS